MDQTAVEWFVGQMFLQGYLNDSPMTAVNINHFVRQAKEMEAEQRQADTNHGYAQGYDDAAQGKEPMQPEMLLTQNTVETPLLTTSTDFHDALSAYYGMYGRLTHPRLEDILKRAFDIGSLCNIFYGRVHVDVERVTHHDNVIQIPEQSLQGAATVYLVDSATWIMFLQSNVNRSEAYAWQIPVMDYYPAYPTTYRITPFNPTLYQEGWRINVEADDELGTYISMHSKPLLKRTHDSQLVTNPTTWQATPRSLSSANYRAYIPPSTADIVDEFMKFWETKQH